MKRLTLCAILLLASLALLTTACSQPAPTALVYGTTEKVSDMDTANAYDFHTWEIFQNINIGLMTYEAGTTNLVPGVAESYAANEKSDEFTFKLRAGLKFTDGTAFDASVVKWTIDRVAALKGDPSWLVTDFVKEVQVIDPLTVKFVLKGPIAYFPALIATPPYHPLNPNVYPADKIVKDPSELKGGKLDGLGPYVVSSYKRDQEVVLEANPNYFGTKPNINKVIIKYFADATTLRLAIEKGEIDLAFKTLNPSDIKDLSAKDSLNTFQMPGPFIRYLAFETSQSVFKNKQLRQAITALINRPEIMEKVFLNQNAALYSMVPAGMIYHTEDFKTVYGDGNVAKADELLKAAGYSEAKPFAFDLWYTPSHYGDTEVNMAEVLSAQLSLSKLVKVTLKNAEWATYKEQWKKKQMGVFLLGWYPDYVDPDNYTAAFAGTSGSVGMGIYFSDKYWDGLFTQEQTSTDQAKRQAVFEEVQKKWTDDVPTAPIFQGNLYIFTRKNVTGVKIGPTLIFNYDQLAFTK